MSELSPQGGSERFGACEDAVAAGAAEQPLLAAAPLNLRGGWFYRFIMRLGGAIYTLFRRDAPDHPLVGKPLWGPCASPAKRVAWGESEQRNERAFAARRKRRIWSLRRRRGGLWPPVGIPPPPRLRKMRLLLLPGAGKSGIIGRNFRPARTSGGKGPGLPGPALPANL